MIRIKRGRVVAVRAPHPGLLEATVEVEGARARAIAYPDLTGPLSEGDTVVLNTTAVELGLGTGGVHVVMAVEGREPAVGEPDGHAMKLRYTPSQTAIAVVEETERDRIEAVSSLHDLPVVVGGLHSALAPAAIGARARRPGARIAAVITDGGALPVAFSHTVPALRAAGLMTSTITAGQAFGGDLEAVSIHGALAACRGVVEADLVIVAMGPGNLGTGSRWGFASIEVAAVVNAVAAMGGRPVVAPRISFADERPRHRGVSHHTTTALGLALAPAEIAVPTLAPDRAAQVREQLAALLDRHTLVEVELGTVEDALRDPPVALHSMGRGFDDDPDYFRTAAAAGVRAAALLER